MPVPVPLVDFLHFHHTMKRTTIQVVRADRRGGNILSEKFLLAIPVFNEQAHLLQVLTEAARFISEIVVIDDGSTDSTPKLLSSQTLAMTLRHRVNRGYGASLVSAFRFAEQYGYRWLITMDCDRQHEPSFIPRFMAAADEDGHDIVSGSRYLRRFEGYDTPPPDRRRINARISHLLNERLSLNITDAFCGFKAYRVAALRRLTITVPGYAMPIQLWVQAARARLRITEVPVTLIYNDPTRHFGGLLDDPASRLNHYLEIFEAEMANSQSLTTCTPGCKLTVP